MLKSIRNKPFKVLWWTIPIVFGISLIKGNQVVDIQMHDTYLVIEQLHLGILFAIILGFEGGIYWLVSEKKLVGWMTIFHVVVTIFTILGIIIVLTNSESTTEQYDRRYFRVDYYGNWIQLIVKGILLWILSQLIFLINLGISLAKNQQK